MGDNLAPHLSAKAIHIMKLFAEHGHDMDRMLAGHPEIKIEELRQVMMEVMGAMERMASSPASKGSGRGKKKPSREIYQIKITLRGSKPPIWRRVVVSGGLTLERLHEVIQIAMGWYNCHLHQFEIDGESYGDVQMDDLEMDQLDERKFRLCDVVDREKAKFAYQYDFGDGWDHDVLVEKITAAAEGVKTMVCLAGKGRCPPEDCGGIWGYYNLLEILADPKHKEHKMIKEWAGAMIDPTEFDSEEVTESLNDLEE